MQSSDREVILSCVEVVRNSFFTRFIAEKSFHWLHLYQSCTSRYAVSHLVQQQKLDDVIEEFAKAMARKVPLFEFLESTDGITE
jgi:hypothetical protein